MSPPLYAPVIASAGLLLVLVTWVTYLASIPRGTVPVRPVGSVVVQVLGVSAAGAAIVLALRIAGTSLAATIPPAAMALTMGGLFLYILTQRRTPVGELAVAVGDELLPFAATDAQGEPFDSASLAGQRVLLKFFRGHW